MMSYRLGMFELQLLTIALANNDPDTRYRLGMFELQRPEAQDIGVGLMLKTGYRLGMFELQPL